MILQGLRIIVIFVMSVSVQIAHVCSGLSKARTEPFPELYFWICTQVIKVQQKIQNNVLTKEKKQCLCTIFYKQ